MPTTAFSDKLFIGYLLILVWAPLPLASNRDWSLSLLILLCLLLAAAVIGQSLKNNIPVFKTLKPHYLIIGLLALVPLWATIQSLQLPPSLVQSLSPDAAAIYESTPARNYSLSLEPGETGMLALFSWALWLFFLLSIVLVNTPPRMKTVFWTVVLCGLFQALYGSFMTLTGLEYGFFAQKEAYLGRATGTFVNRNHLAGYLEMTLAVGIGLLVATLGRRRHRNWRARMRHTLDTLLGPKMRLRVFLALMVIALVLTRSRMGNTAFFLSLPLCGMLMMIMQRKLHKGAIVLFVSLMLVDFLIVGQWFGFDELADRLQNTTAEAETRDEVVRDSLVMLQDYSLTGTGAGTFYSSYPRYRQADVNGFYDHAHNDYLEFAATFGLIGFLPLGIVVLLALWTALRSMYKRHDQLARGVAFAATMGIISLLLHSAVDFNLHIPANALLFVTLLAFGVIAKTVRNDNLRHGIFRTVFEM